MPSHPHDRLVRRIFSNPMHAAAELRTALPRELVTALDLAALEVVPGASYIDEELAECQVDLLYRVPLCESGESALVYVLLEHQSSVDPRMPARLLVYMCRIWEQWMRENPGGKLPLIVPAVLHHSSTGWTAPTRFAELLAIPETARASLQGSLLDFEFFLGGRASRSSRHGRSGC